MRTGWSDPSLAVENALAAEAAGVSALAMHGRTREQMYTGHADLETLHKVAQAPVSYTHLTLPTNYSV